MGKKVLTHIGLVVKNVAQQQTDHAGHGRQQSVETETPLQRTREQVQLPVQLERPQVGHEDAAARQHGPVDHVVGVGVAELAGDDEQLGVWRQQKGLHEPAALL